MLNAKKDDSLFQRNVKKLFAGLITQQISYRITTNHIMHCAGKFVYSMTQVVATLSCCKRRDVEADAKWSQSFLIGPLYIGPLM